MSDRAGREKLYQAYRGLEREVPDFVARALRWLHSPKARRIRIPLGITLIVLSFFWFLPVIGLEFLPIGLLLIAHDIPFLRTPVARALIWLEHKWVLLRHWWERRRRKTKKKLKNLKSGRK